MTVPLEIRRGSRVVGLTSPDRVLRPEEGITQGDLIEYYRAGAPVRFAHLVNLPFTR